MLDPPLAMYSRFSQMFTLTLPVRAILEIGSSRNSVYCSFLIGVHVSQGLEEVCVVLNFNIQKPTSLTKLTMHPSLTRLVVKDSSKSTMLTQNLVWTSDQHNTVFHSGPELNQFLCSQLRCS